MDFSVCQNTLPDIWGQEPSTTIKFNGCDTARGDICAWELYYRTFLQYFINNASKSYRIKSLHCGESPITLDGFKKIKNKLEYETRAKVDWNYLATGRNIPDENFIKMVDGTDDLSIENQRAISNRINLTIKTINLIILHNIKNIPGAIAFTIRNLQNNGCVLINVTDATLDVSLIYLLSCCFKKIKILKLNSSKSTYIYGEDFNIKLHRKKLSQLDLLTDQKNIITGIFTRPFYRSEHYLEFAELLKAEVDELNLYNSAYDFNTWKVIYNADLF